MTLCVSTETLVFFVALLVDCGSAVARRSYKWAAAKCKCQNKGRKRGRKKKNLNTVVAVAVIIVVTIVILNGRLHIATITEITVRTE
jgi:hypothetical protein